jgi:dihydroorotate dehydrogenase electron transfer subunit
LPSSRLYQATILSHEDAGRGFYRLELKAPEAARTAVPGQFVMLRVSENLDPLLARPFGISSVHHKRSLAIYYRVVGKGTRMLTAVKTGQMLGLLGPLGRGFPLPTRGVLPLLIMGGSGFPPLHYLSLRTGKHAHSFVGARNKECLPPAGVLKDLKAASAGLHIVTEDGSLGKQGITTDLLESFLSKTELNSKIVIYACGPHAMLANVSRIAAAHAITCYVSMEERMACGLGACMGCSVPVKTGGYKRACKEGPVFDSRDIEWGEQVLLTLRGRTVPQ